MSRSSRGRGKLLRLLLAMPACWSADDSDSASICCTATRPAMTALEKFAADSDVIRVWRQSEKEKSGRRKVHRNNNRARIHR